MKVELWTDFVCEYCYIGKVEFQNALENFPHKEEVEVIYRSFELDPHAPANPTESYYRSVARKNNVREEEVKATIEPLVARAASLGFNYHPEKWQELNTHDAHRLAKYALAQGHSELCHRLSEAYLGKGVDLSDHGALIQLAVEEGLDETEVEKVLENQSSYNREIKDDRARAQAVGMQGVPFFVFNNHYAVSGAQTESTFKEILGKVWDEEQ